MRVGLYEGSGLGDGLCLTPLFKYFTDGIIELPDVEWSRNYSAIFEGIANIKYVKEKPIIAQESAPYPERKHPFIHGALNFLKMWGIEDKVSPIPKVHLNTETLEWAERELSQYTMPIIVSLYPRGYENPNDAYARWKMLPDECWQEIVDELKTRYTLLHLPNKNVLKTLDGIVSLPQYNLHQLKHLYAVCGIYLGVDTGPPHLMLAVGGHSYTIVPPNSWDHQYWGPNWQYTEDLWELEPKVRAKYYLKENYREVLNDL